MKKLNFMIALFASFILISCSGTINEPVDGDVNKSMDAMYPYDYLQSFEEVGVTEWQSPASRDNGLSIRLDRNIEDIEDVFIMVTYGNPLTDDEGLPFLYFVDHAVGAETIKLTLDYDAPVKHVKAFVLSKFLETEIEPPYPAVQRFNGISSTYEVIENEIIISAMPWTADIVEVYAHISKIEGDELIYLQLPSSNQKIILSDLPIGEVTGIHLFVKSIPIVN